MNPSDPNENIIEAEKVRPDPIHPDFTHLRDIYFSVDPEYKGRFTVPTLYDIKQKKIVSNESSEILRMFYTEFDDLIDEKYKKVDLFPKELQADIEETNKWTYDEINNGVYKTGFATWVFLVPFSLPPSPPISAAGLQLTPFLCTERRTHMRRL